LLIAQNCNYYELELYWIDMRKLIILITIVILVLPIACNVNNSQELDPEAASSTRPSLEGNQLSPIAMAMVNVGYTLGYSLSNELSAEKNLRMAGPGLDVPKKLFSNNSWVEADKILRNEFQKVLGEDDYVSDEERRLTKDIQRWSLTMLNDLEKSANLGSTETSKSAVYYIRILYRHKGIDLNRMADGLVLAKSELNIYEYEEIKNYLVIKADKQTALALERFDRYNQEYNTTVDENEKRKWFNALKRLQSMTEEAEYVRELLADNKK
jgi:hypothetical protein